MLITFYTAQTVYKSEFKVWFSYDQYCVNKIPLIHQLQMQYVSFHFQN